MSHTENTGVCVRRKRVPIVWTQEAGEWRSQIINEPSFRDFSVLRYDPAGANDALEQAGFYLVRDGVTIEPRLAIQSLYGNMDNTITLHANSVKTYATKALHHALLVPHAFRLFRDTAPPAGVVYELHFES